MISCMLDNHHYNLHLQLVQEHKALWRIQNMYKKDSEGCDSCQVFWTKLERDKKEHVDEILGFLKEH